MEVLYNKSIEVLHAKLLPVYIVLIARVIVRPLISFCALHLYPEMSYMPRQQTDGSDTSVAGCAPKMSTALHFFSRMCTVLSKPNIT